LERRLASRPRSPRANLFSNDDDNEEQMKQFWSRALVAAVLACLPGIAAAANYDESVNGDLSGVGATPTSWALDAGANVIKGTAGTSSDFDIVHINVPVGHQLSSLYLDAYSNLSLQSFLGVQSGSTWTAGTGGAVNGGALIGYVLFDTGLIGADMLPDIGTNGMAFGTGFTPPLPTGDYTLLIQDTQTPFSYEFTLNVAVVPEPATISLAALGLLAITRIRRR
jgi:hypothetical protein